MKFPKKYFSPYSPLKVGARLHPPRAPANDGPDCTYLYQPLQNLDIGIDEEEEDEFFDCNEQWDESSSLAKWSSMELETLDTSMDHANNPNQVEPPVSFRRVQSLHERSSTTPIDLEPQPLSARPNFMSR